MHEMTITFPGGNKVDAHFLGFDVPTDQRKEHGGDQSAPNPFDYFFVAIATCAGSSALGYCQKHKIPTAGMQLRLQTERHTSEPRIERITMHLSLPPAFPHDQIIPLRETLDRCTVKRHIMRPPSFEMVISEAPANSQE